MNKLLISNFWRLRKNILLWLSLTFSNTAKELNTVEVGKLFDRFYTVDSARKSTGLGLSIAKLLTERMGGTIGAEYSDGNLEIIISFPNVPNVA